MDDVDIGVFEWVDVDIVVCLNGLMLISAFHIGMGLAIPNKLMTSFKNFELHYRYYCIASYFRGMYISRIATSILVHKN